MSYGDDITAPSGLEPDAGEDEFEVADHDSEDEFDAEDEDLEWDDGAAARRSSENSADRPI